ncbi:MAG: ABC transporter ATP-binding protein [Planctomycetota bacterium]|jgi:phospholipid/cholesterol/gamma-HCH transport system ATP-binding protein
MIKKEVHSESGIIVVKNIVKKFGEELVLDNISLAAKEGKTTVIIGPSGCGKTVLMKHMIALERPLEGEVYFKGRRIDNLSERQLEEVRTQYGFCFQSGALFDSLNVYENIIFPIRQHHKITDWKAISELVKSKLAMVGMDGYQTHFPANLSGGQQKRVALARAIAMDPHVILYDEPTTGLDPIRSDIINELILKLQAELEVTSVVVTHDMKSAYKIADRIVMLHEGKVIADGDADHIRNHPHPAVQQFIHGRVGEADLAALRLGGTKFKTQYAPEDFK